MHAVCFGERERRIERDKQENDGMEEIIRLNHKKKIVIVILPISE